MKKYLILISLLVGIHNVAITQNNWYPISANNYSFEMIDTPIIVVDTNVIFYQGLHDSIHNMQAHFIDSFYVSSMGVTVDSLLNLFTQQLLFLSNGQLVSLQNTSTANYNGRSIGIQYNEGNGLTMFMFIQLYCWQGHLLSCSITGKQSDLLMLNAYKNYYFQTIQIF